MEQLKKTVMETGKKLLQGALGLMRTTAEATVNLMGRAAGHAVVFARDKGGALVKSAGGKVKATVKDHRQSLLLITAAVSGVIMAVSLIGWLLGRKK